MERNLKLFAFCFLMAVGAPHTQFVEAQTLKKEIRIEADNQAMPQVLKQLEKKSGYKILFTNDDLNQFRVSVDFKTKDIRDALNAIIGNRPLEYTIRQEGNYVSIRLKNTRGAVRRANQQAAQAFEMIHVSGTVIDAGKSPIPGVHIEAVGTDYRCISDMTGQFHLNLPKGQPFQLRFSFVGMQTVTSREYDARYDVERLYVTMEEDQQQLDEVVVTGMFERKKESFTGSSTTFSKDDLMAVGNQNLIKSLKNLDPAFQIVENLEMGSNPNAMPEIQMRGETSFNIQGDYDGNANQPLFILDGFETTLEKIWDLDMNRVQSVTLLKDAAAKAIYGSKAGNGVVVIETIRPKSGEMRISYSGSLDLEVPDLSDYNLMNAREKYQWELDHDRYTNWAAMNSPMYADLLNKSVYDAIASGVDTYWLSKPLETGIGQKHSISLEGGDSRVRYILGASYNDVAGVMKESGRRTFNINSTLSYTYKNMVFRNQLDYTQNTSKNSPYGSFSDYIGLEPYYAPYDENGELKQILGYQTVMNNGFSSPVYNPLYNATLNTKDESSYTSFTENFEMDWHINERFRFTAKFSYTRQDNSSDLFYPASHTMFIEYDDNGFGDRKGQYTKTNGYTKDLSAQVGLNWNQTFLDKHSLFANFTWNIQSSESRSTTVMAEGFGNDNMDDISQATYYYRDSHPTGSDSKTREVGFIGALNYSYDDRYLLDASYRYSGSSMYGADNHWGGFWSVGAGWNIHNEHFFPEESIVKLLKLRWSLGYTGTQNFNPYQARATYEYGDIYYDGRLGTTIMGIPNTRLKWQRVFDSNYGFDLALGSFLTLRAEYYTQNTDNLLSDITLPPSAGFTTYKENLGEIQNKGVEVALSVTPWRNNEERGWLTFTFSAQHNKNTIKKIYDIFNQSNDAADDAINSNEPGYGSSDEDWNEYHLQTTRPATKYYEGCSMTAIWGVRSLGIDPMSGREMFLDKNGNPTFDYSTDDQVVIGDTNPKLRGNFGISGGWRGFTFSMTASYKLGGDLYNTTLVDRVENVSGFGNLDKRVAETWLNPGDHAKYRSITMGQSATDYQITKPTSRFVQSDDEIYFSSLSVGYEFTSVQYPWVNRIGMERLKLGFTANELARFSKVKVERGTSYPFARTFSFTLNASF